jgi:YVTN family beta-propeller protein
MLVLIFLLKVCMSFYYFVAANHRSDCDVGPRVPDQLQVGGDPEDIAVNPVTNKIYILKPGDSTVTVLDSKSGTVKNIPVGLGGPGGCPHCIAVDSTEDKIYVANSYSDTVSVIDGNNDTVKKTIKVGLFPKFILLTSSHHSYHPSTITRYLPSIIGTYCKIYVANNIPVTWTS